MPILNYTTQISAHKTIAEVQQKLVGKGAQAVSVEYEAGVPSALTFTIKVSDRPVQFKLPTNYDGVYKAMCRAKGVPYRLQTREQAVRVCWRILKDWIEAQLAIIEAGQATLPEVFLAYALNSDGQTLFEHFSGNPALLTGGAAPKLLTASEDAIDAEIMG
jgi:hypothetical protein